MEGRGSYNLKETCYPEEVFGAGFLFGGQAMNKDLIKEMGLLDDEIYVLESQLRKAQGKKTGLVGVIEREKQKSTEKKSKYVS